MALGLSKLSHLSYLLCDHPFSPLLIRRLHLNMDHVSASTFPTLVQKTSSPGRLDILSREDESIKKMAAGMCLM